MLLLADSDRSATGARSGSRGVTAGFIAALLILAALGLDVLGSAFENRALSLQRTQARKLLVGVTQLSSAIQDAEMAALGFVASRQPTELDATQQGGRRVAAQLVELRGLGLTQVIGPARQAAIERLVDTRLAELRDATAAVVEPGEALRLARTGGDGQTRAALRRELELAEGQIGARLEARSRSALAGLERQLMVLPAAGAVSVALLLAAYGWLRREIARRQLTAAALAEANARLAEDLVEREHAGALLRGKNEELAQATDRAKAADRVKSAFLASMSHELRTPLNSIIGFTGILLQELPGPVNAEQRKQLEMVRGSSRHLLALINDVLDISKIEAGEMNVRREPLELGALLERVASLMRPLAEGKGLSLRLEPAPGPVMTVGDPRRVEQVLLNLAGNAVKFTERGGIVLTAATDGAMARVQVRDSGPGIAATDLESVFTPFRQLDTGLARDHEGSGLGLAISQRLARLMGGSITVESEPGHGSVFVFTLPGSQEGKP